MANWILKQLKTDLQGSTITMRVQGASPLQENAGHWALTYCGML